MNSLSDMGLLQINNVHNSSNRLLDLVFVNEPNECTVIRHQPITRPEDRHHPTLEVSFNYNFENKLSSNKVKTKIYCFNNDLNYMLTNTNWVDLLKIDNASSNNIEKITNSFYNIIYS